VARASVEPEPRASLTQSEGDGPPTAGDDGIGEGRKKRDAVATHRGDTNLPFGNGAEFRSRLSWFIGVSDAGPQDPGSLTYERYFGLREKPFSLSSDPRFFFSNSGHGAAFDRLAAGIRRREGILVLTGEVGTGKTTLCRAMFQSLDQKTFAAFVPDPFLSREDLLKILLVDFGVVSAEEIRTGRLRGVSRTDLSYPLYDFLASLQPLKAFAVVMIDEAQNLTTELLEEIRILSDLENRQKLLQVLLVGQPELQRRLATPAMRQLSQRVSIRCELMPFAREDVKPYVSHRLAIAGNDGRVQFTDAAIDLVGTASNGTPRVINLVCDRALFRAANSQTLTVDAEHVVWAVDDLKLTVAQPLRAPFGDQPATGLASFLEELQEVSTAREDRHHPAPQGEGLSSAGSGGKLDELFGSGFPDAGAPKPAIAEDSPADRRRRTRLLALAGTLLAVATSLAGHWCSSAPASRQQSALQPAEPPRPLLREPPVGAMDLFPPPESRVTGSPNPSDRTDTKVSPGQAAARLALQMATFQSPARAAQALQEFRDAGYHAYIIEVSLRDGEHAFAVFLGPYADVAPAERDLDRARQMTGYGSGHLVQLDPSLRSPAAQP
jgi:type II secretory pathway predicted ATPase ExeA/cell division septation protein DedD